MEFTRAYVNTEIKEWNDFFFINQRFLSQFVFRGQANSDWSLKTSLERLIDNHYPSPIRDNLLSSMYEKEMLKEFKWKFPIYEKNYIPNEDEYIEWLAIMQHYGASTRLLDFSTSLYIALFMALDGSFYEKSSIWGINTIVVNSAIHEKLRKLKNTNVTYEREIDKYSYLLSNEAIKKGDPFQPIPQNEMLFLVKPHMTNQRISRQKGIFMVPSITNVPLSIILNNYYESNNHINLDIKDFQRLSNERLKQNAISIIKIDIPKKIKYQLTKVLNQMNITSETMYPGLEGLAKSTSILRLPMGQYND